MEIELRHNVKRVAIIGAGPSGVATAKYLIAERAFEKIDVFEQRATVGGVWNYTPEVPTGTTRVPQVNPHQPVEEPQYCDREAVNGKDISPRRSATFVTPMYDHLETNIPTFLMRFSDKPFPADSQLFPGREEVMRYLTEYAKDVQHLIRFQSQVLDVRLLKSASQEHWVVKTKNLQSQHSSEAAYDAVVVANGHFNVPYVPDIEGITGWNAHYPGVISHSKSYRMPDVFRGKKVIVVGNAASGLDIGAQISTVCKLPIIFSQRSVSYLSPGAETYKDEVPEIVEFLPSAHYSRGVRFADGRIEQNVDAIIFCTGYLYSYPFLDRLEPRIIGDGMRVQHVYQHIFYNDHPTLAFVGLPVKIIPFQTSEAQAAVIARVWSGRLGLPPREEMCQWEDSVTAERGAGKGFHMLGFPLDADYLDELYDWATTAELDPRLDDSHGNGKLPKRWGEEERWARERFPAIKKAFAQRGKGRHTVRSLKELGYDFEAWKRETGSFGPSSLL